MWNRGEMGPEQMEKKNRLMRLPYILKRGFHLSSSEEETPVSKREHYYCRGWEVEKEGE